MRAETYVRKKKSADEKNGVVRPFFPWQENALKKYYEKDKRGTKFLTISAGRRAGKALDVDTPILTVGGFKRMGDIVAGDKVFDENGNVCNVIHAFDEYYTDDVYEITFVDGEKIVADEQHNWKTFTHNERKSTFRKDGRVGNRFNKYNSDTFQKNWGQTQEKRTTKEIYDTRFTGKRRDNNHSIPLALPLNTIKSDLPIDPWLLGYWLGDGNTNSGGITVGERDIEYTESRIKSLCSEYSVRKDKTAYRITKYGLQVKLRELGVLGNKRIPDIYKMASIEDRISLLRGLMDSDGYADNRKNSVEFCSIRKELAEDVLFLVRSLSEKPVMKESDAKLYGRVTSKRYRITWRPSLIGGSVNPFSMPRKVERIKKSLTRVYNYRQRIIKNIEKTSGRVVRCISVDSQSNLFLAGNGLIPTHNSSLTAELIKINAMTLPDAKIVFTALTIGNAKRIMWDELLTLCGTENVKVNEQKNEIRIKNVFGGYSTVYFFGWDNINRMRGISADLVCLDECAFYKRFWDLFQGAVLPATTDRRGRVVFLSSPNGLNHFYDLFNKTGDDYTSVSATIFDNPNISREEIARMKSSVDQLYWRREFMGEFFKKEGLIFHEFNRQRNMITNDKLPEDYTRILVGVDFGYSAPSAILEIGIDLQNRLYVYKETYMKNKLNDYLLNYIQSIGAQEVYPDPAEPDRIAQFEEAGLNVQHVNKSRLPGFDRVNQLFKQGRLFISAEGCPQLISELENFSWDDEKENSPDKESGFGVHGCDALRYVCFNAAVAFVATTTNTSKIQNKNSGNILKYKTII